MKNEDDAPETLALTPGNTPQDPNIEKVFTLPSGKVATVYKAKGRDVRQAQKIAGTDGSLFMPALWAIKIRIDGVQMLMEDFDELSDADYMELTTETAGNFTK